MPDRTLIPEIRLPEKLDVNIPVLRRLENGIPLHHISAEHIDVVKLELVFEAGIWQQKKPLEAMFTAQLLKEGSQSYTSAEIAEKLDYYGAYLHCQHSHHHCSVTLFALKKHLPHLLPVLESIVKEPVFDENELRIAISNKRQEFIIESEKVKTLAVREFNKAMFGVSHPYANNLCLADFDQIKSGDLIAFHKTFFNASDCTIFLTGKMDEELTFLIENSFGKNWKKGKDGHVEIEEMHLGPKKRFFVPKGNAIQSGLRLGRKAVLKNHPDFHELSILITILGGYFGSRLMRNIREDKGYTYGINANLLANKYHSVFTIQSEMATEYTLPVIKEIFSEFDTLREKRISDEELKMVKNYLLGELARSFDGPFSCAESHLMLWMFDLDVKHVDDYVKAIHDISPERLQMLANQWLDAKDWIVVVAGNPNLEQAFLEL